MSIQLEIPDSVWQALRLPQAEQSLRLKTELALSLYAQGILPFGKARELSGLGQVRVWPLAWQAQHSSSV